jgi:hypothetical protein
MDQNRAVKYMMHDIKENKSMPEEYLPIVANYLRLMWQVGWEHDKTDITDAKDSILLSEHLKSTSQLL